MSQCDYYPHLLNQYRCEIATEINAATQTDSSLTYDEWKKLFYFWKYQRNINTRNEFYLDDNPSLYFAELDTNNIID